MKGSRNQEAEKRAAESAKRTGEVLSELGDLKEILKNLMTRLPPAV